MTTILSSVFVFLLVILLHEFGHFFVAKKVGIQVNEFAIGMGPKIYSKEKGETTYSLRALPIGGFCAMEGEEEESDNPRSFDRAPLKSRCAVVVAGAVMNFLLALVAFFLASLLMGTPSNVVGEVMDQYPAQVAGIEVGDEIIAVNGVKVASGEEIIKEISKAKDVQLSLNRDGQTLTKDLKTKTQEGRQLIGIQFDLNHSLVQSVKESFQLTGKVIASIFTVFHLIFTGQFQTKMLAGPIGVIQVIGQSSSQGFAPLLYILGMISANLGVVNLLPIPALDGGKLLFLLLEGIRGKKMDPDKEAYFTMAGMALLFGLMIYITVFSDLKRIF